MHPEQIRIFKAMKPAAKLALAATFYFASRELKTKAFRTLHPEWSEEKIQKRVKELFLYGAN